MVAKLYFSFQKVCDRFGEEAGVVRAGAGLTWGTRFPISLLGVSSPELFFFQASLVPLAFTRWLVTWAEWW